MPGSLFNKIGRLLSIFGVSSPEDIRRMQQRKSPYKQTGTEAGKSPISSSQPSIQPKAEDRSPLLKTNKEDEPGL